MKKTLIFCFAILGIVTSTDIILSEFFNIGTLEIKNAIFLYLLLYLFENELKDFPQDIISNKWVKYPMYISVSLSLLVYFGII